MHHTEPNVAVKSGSFAPSPVCAPDKVAPDKVAPEKVAPDKVADFSPFPLLVSPWSLSQRALYGRSAQIKAKPTTILN